MKHETNDFKNVPVLVLTLIMASNAMGLDTWSFRSSMRRPPSKSACNKKYILYRPSIQNIHKTNSVKILQLTDKIRKNPNILITKLRRILHLNVEQHTQNKFKKATYLEILIFKYISTG